MCPSRRVDPLVVRTSALRSIGCEKSRASLSVSVCAVPQPKLEICRAAPARPVAPWGSGPAAARGACRAGGSETARARLFTCRPSNGTRKFIARRSQTAPPAALAFTHSHHYKTRTVSCPIPSIMVTEQLLFTYVVHEKPFILHSWLCRPREECTRSTWRPIH
jgi:hypothetical protein